MKAAERAEQIARKSGGGTDAEWRELQMAREYGLVLRDPKQREKGWAVTKPSPHISNRQAQEITRSQYEGRYGV